MVPLGQWRRKRSAPARPLFGQSARGDAGNNRGTARERLALAHGLVFLCRSAFEENGTRADNTQHVGFGDVLHVYFTDDGDPKVIGTFQVIGPNKHPDPCRFGKTVPGTMMFEVADSTFESRLAP